MADWLEQSIAAIAPAWALDRARARAALQVVRSYAYEAANGGSKRTSTWTTPGSGANTANDSALARVRNNARDLVRNNPYGRRAVDIFAAKAIGTGIRARWPSKAPQTVWAKWAKRCDFDNQLDLYGLESLVARGQFEGGEMLVRRVYSEDWKADVAAGIVPLRLQVLEPDFIDASKWGVSGENMIIAGIEINRRGQRVAYWLFDSHPGEQSRGGLQSRRHDAAGVLHFYEKRRAGQMRDVSRFAASMMRLRHLDEWQEAVLVKKKIESCFVGWVEGGSSSRPLGEGATNAVTGRRTETFSPGAIIYGGAGEKIQFGQPSSSDDSAYTSDELHAIAVGCGLTYEQLTGDLTRVSFSSIRAGVQDFRDLIDAWRWIYFIPMMMSNGIEQWFLEAAWTSGLLRSRNYDAIWTAPRWPYIQPVDDIKARKEEIRAGLTSTSASIREGGEDPEEIEDEISEERARWKKKGIAVDTDPATAPKAAPAAEEAATGGNQPGAGGEETVEGGGK